jgi:hypothetical protein
MLPEWKAEGSPVKIFRWTISCSEFAMLKDTTTQFTIVVLPNHQQDPEDGDGISSRNVGKPFTSRRGCLPEKV